MAILTDRQEREIRFKYAAGHSTQRELASEYRVSQAWISVLASTREKRLTRRGTIRYAAMQAKNRIDCTARKNGCAELDCSLDELEQHMKDSTTCALCGGSDTLSVDHCHLTGEFRGMLCSHCNSLLGFAKDDSETLRKAMVYLGGVS